MHLITKGVVGLKWASTANVTKQVLQLTTLMILPYFLSPKDFGLMGMANVVIVFINTFKSLGFSTALIHKQTLTKELFSTVFFVNIILGLSLSVLLYIFAPLISSLLTNNIAEEDVLKSILYVVSAIIFIASPSLIQQSILEKKLLFNNLALIEVLSVLIGSICAIIFAIFGYGVWSLVIQNLVVVSISSIMLWFLCPIKPKFVFRIDELRSVLKFSLNLTGFQLINYFARNADKILIGKFLGATELGYYSLAYRIVLYPLQNITNLISRVVFPIYSKVQDENEKIKKGFKLVANSIAIITFPLLFGIALISSDLIFIFWGDQWSTVANLIVFLAPIAAIQSITTTTGSIYQSKGRTDIMFKWGIVLGVTFVISYFLGLSYGVIGVAKFYLIANVILIFPWLYYPLRLIKLNTGEFLLDLKGVIFSTICMVMVVQIAGMFIGNLFSPLIYLIILILSGVSSYIIASLLFNKSKIKQIFHVIKLKNIA